MSFKISNQPSGTSIAQKQSQNDIKLTIPISQIVENNDLIHIFSPGGQRKITIKRPKIPIRNSGIDKQNELQSLSNQILSMTVVPDFGYQAANFEERDLGGWKMFYDYVKKEPKFQKLTNYIQKSHEVKSERQQSLKKRKVTDKVKEDMIQINVHNDNQTQRSQISKELELLIGMHNSETEFLNRFKKKAKIRYNTNTNQRPIKQLDAHIAPGDTRNQKANTHRYIEIQIPDSDSSLHTNEEKELLNKLTSKYREIKRELGVTIAQGCDILELEKWNQQLASLRNQKIQLGILLRAVNSQDYQKVSEDLKELEYFKRQPKFYQTVKDALIPLQLKYKPKIKPTKNEEKTKQNKQIYHSFDRSRQQKFRLPEIVAAQEDSNNTTINPYDISMPLSANASNTEQSQATSPTQLGIMNSNAKPQSESRSALYSLVNIYKQQQQTKTYNSPLKTTRQQLNNTGHYSVRNVQKTKMDKELHEFMLNKVQGKQRLYNAICGNIKPFIQAAN